MDRYANYAALQREQMEGRDYQVVVKRRDGSDVTIIAPHGGAIEPGTSEIAVAIAGFDCNLALFEGIKKNGNGDLHITSTNFDEPRCLDVVRSSRVTVAIHGERSGQRVAYVGGADFAYGERIGAALKEAGFCVRAHANPNLQGASAANICNRATTSMGVQLELTRGLRDTFFRSLDANGRTVHTALFTRFVDAVRKGLDRDAL